MTTERTNDFCLHIYHIKKKRYLVYDGALKPTRKRRLLHLANLLSSVLTGVPTD